MKKFSISVVSIILAISFFFVNSVPVFADYDVDTYIIPSWQVVSYQYWNNIGYNYTQSFNNSTNIAVPMYYTETGNTNYSLICNEPNYTGQSNDYACFYRDNSSGQIYGTWNRFTNVAHTEVEQNISLQGAEIPWLRGTYQRDTAYNLYHAVNCLANQTIYFSFISNYNLWNSSTTVGNSSGNNYLKVYSRDNVDTKVVRIYSNEVSNAYQYSFSITNLSDKNTFLNFDVMGINSNTAIIPIYIGNGNDLNDFIKQQLGIDTDTEKALNNISSKIDSISTNINLQLSESQKQNSTMEFGNTFSQGRQQALSDSNTTLNNRVDQMNSIETEYNSDLNTALDDIDLSTDLVQHTGFTNAALWVSAQFNRLVLGTPFELVMTFSLITGLALVLIGKMRG